MLPENWLPPQTAGWSVRQAGAAGAVPAASLTQEMIMSAEYYYPHEIITIIRIMSEFEWITRKIADYNSRAVTDVAICDIIFYSEHGQLPPVSERSIRWVESDLALWKPSDKVGYYCQVLKVLCDRHGFIDIEDCFSKEEIQEIEAQFGCRISVPPSFMAYDDNKFAADFDRALGDHILGLSHAEFWIPTIRWPTLQDWDNWVSTTLQ